MNNARLLLCADIDGSIIPDSVLVNNASDNVKNTVTQVAKQKGLSDTLYIASNCDIGMDGNYVAGEQGIWHFAPDFRRQIQTPDQASNN